MGWQGTNGLSWDIITFSQKTSCCHQDLISGIYNFHCLQVQVLHGIYCYICRMTWRERGGDLSIMVRSNIEVLS